MIIKKLIQVMKSTIDLPIPILKYVVKFLICITFVFYNYNSYAQIETFWELDGNSLVSISTCNKPLFCSLLHVIRI